MDPIVERVHAVTIAGDWDALRPLLHPYLHWTDAEGTTVRGRSKVIAVLRQAAEFPAEPASIELRDGQIYRWRAQDDTAGQWQDPPASWIVTGNPVGYSSGAAEQEWKARIKAAVPHAHGALGLGAGLFAEFRMPLGHGFDLDNLLDPVLSSVVNAQGWFSGRRRNLQWIAARKLVHGEPGASLAVLPHPPLLWEESDVEVGVDAVYTGDLPIPGKIEGYAAWVKARMRPLSSGGVGVAIDFPNGKVNLGDIATGPAKTLIDGLWPILGGGPGAPDDGRVTALVIRKGLAELNGAVAIKVVGLADH